MIKRENRERAASGWRGKALGIVVLWTLAAFPATALTPYLVRDIDTVPREDGSDVDVLHTFDNGLTLFAAHDDEGLGRELWASDGTAAGTVRLVDACPGSCSSFPSLLAGNGSWALVAIPGATASIPPDLWLTRGTVASTVRVAQAMTLEPLFTGLLEWSTDRSRVFFRASTQGFGRELWTSDGTAAGTRRVADLEPGFRGSDPSSLKYWNGRLYFSAADSRRGRALWKTDGTAAGTVLVKDTNPTSASPTGGPVALTATSRRLYFSAAPPGRLTELWVSDGTTAGTIQLTKISQASSRTGTGAPNVVGDRIYFLGVSARDGQELWATDGTVATTRKLTAFPRAAAFEEPSGAITLRGTALGSRFVFRAHNGAAGEELWVTDGTTAGTRLLRDFCPGACSSQPFVVTPLGGRLFIEANGGPATGRELWVSDGTPAGTRLAKDICPGACSGGAGFVTTFGPRLFFAAFDSTSGRELWTSDGTTAGTRLVADLCPGPCSAGPSRVFDSLPGAFLLTALEADAGDRALFRIDGASTQVSRLVSFDFGGILPFGVPPVRPQILFGKGDPQLGRELWRTDGTVLGTYMVRNLSTTDRGGSRPSDFLALGSSALFLADDGVHGRELWKSDGTSAGTELVHEFVPGPDGAPDDIDGASVEIAGKRFFFLDERFRLSLWVSDGTAAGTRRLTPEGVGASADGEMVAVGGTVYFVARGRLWASDGTPAGTREVSERATSVHELTPFRGKLYFSASDGFQGKLWMSDGTSAGTVPLEDQDLDEESARVADLLEFRNQLYFLAQQPGGFEPTLFKSDGTQGSAVPIVEVEGAQRLYAAGERLYIAGEDGFFASDGTAAGTHLVNQLRVNLASSVVAFRGQLFFVLQPDDRLWKSDGTAAGTVRIQDAHGNDVVVFGGLFELGGRLVFGGALDQTGPPVLWQSDGTAASTAPILDGSGEPLFAHTGDAVGTPTHLWLQGFDRDTGFELWAVRPE